MLAPLFMNEILFGQKNFLTTQENFLQKLNPYMLTHENWEIMKNKMVPPQLPVLSVLTELPKPPVLHQVFKPNMKDTLFWCMYAANNGIGYFQTQIQKGVNMVNLMMNEKKTMSDHFNKTPTLLKNSNHKITLSKINEICCNLMTKPTMDSIDSCIPCAIYYNRPVYVYYKEIHSFLKFSDKNYVSDSEEDTNIILLYANGGKISLETDTTKVLEFIKMTTNLFCLNTYEKPLSGISNYKTEELKQLYTIVFESDEILKKPEYYEKILVKCTAVVNEKIY